MKDLNKFIYYTTDGKRHEKTLTDEEERSDFIYWLETDKSVADFIYWLETGKSVVKWY